MSQSPEILRALELLLEQQSALWAIAEDEVAMFRPDEPDDAEHGFWRFEAYADAIAAWATQITAEGALRDPDQFMAVPRLDEAGPFGRWLRIRSRAAPAYVAYATTVEVMRLMIHTLLTSADRDYEDY